MKSRAFLPPLVLLPCFLCSCIPDFTAAPDNAQIGCQSNEDCPEGWTCVAALEKCVKAENIANEPQTSNESIKVYAKGDGSEKVEAADGDRIRVRFDVGQELDLGATEVRLETTVFENEEWSQDEESGTYHYVYVTSASSSIGNGKKEITVNAVSLLGGTYRKVVGTATLNFHKPEIAGDVSLVFDKPVSCPLSGSAIAGVTRGTIVTLSFWATEELLNGKPSNAVLKLDQGGNNRELKLPDPQVYGLFYIYKFDVPADVTLEDGEYKLFMTLEDHAKNKNDIAQKKAGAGLLMKFSNPSPPDTETQDKLIFRRKPWGTKDTNSVKTFTVTAGDGVVDSQTTWVLAYDGSDAATALELGRAPIRDRTFATAESDPRTMKLSGTDRIEVHLASYDAACNRSALVKVKDAEWYATMGYKVPGSTIENPHVFRNVGIFQKMLNQDLYVVEPEVYRGRVSENGRQKWDQRMTQDQNELPPEDVGCVLAYDSARGKMVLYGGVANNETWERDEENWTKKKPLNEPAARHGHAMSYDSARGKVVMFGGDIFSLQPSNETWEWDGENWAQKNPTIKPWGRYGHAMVYDAVRGRVVMFGGNGGGKFNNETWEWDGVNWTQFNPQNSPMAREYHAMAFDIARGKTVLFGGYADSGIYFNDTWEWDGFNWAQLFPADSPVAREYHAMTYDSSHRKVLLFGGLEEEFINDTWEWDGVNWTQKNLITKPSFRGQHALAYDSVRGKAVLFGGWAGGSLINNETWEWDGVNWIQKNLMTKPIERAGHAMSFDNVHGNTLLFGGYDGNDLLNDTWEWDGDNWFQKTATNIPSSRVTHAMAYDGARGKAVLFGGNTGTLNNETWEWDGVNWTQKHPTVTPTARDRHAMAYDGERGKVVLFGGNTGTLNNETWEWDGVKWEKKDPIANPSARAWHTITYYSAKKRVVLFGGWTDTDPFVSDETWEWDGVNWIQKLPSVKPQSRIKHAMTYDSSRGKAVLLGGQSVANWTWEWDGVNWEKKIVTIGPEQCNSHAIAYDSIRGKVVFYGGYTSTSYLNHDTWEWDGQGNGNAGQVAEINVQASGIFSDEVAMQVKKVTASFFSGGIGYPQGVIKTGVNLMAWYDSEWHTVASNSDGPKAPGLVEWSTSDEKMIWKLMYSGGMNFNFAVVPQAPNGFGHPNCPSDWTAEECDMGMISTEYTEVVLKYRLP